MKSYDETVNDVFERINEYKTAKKRKRKVVASTAVCLCCVCLVAFIGIGSYRIIASPDSGAEQTTESADNTLTSDRNRSASNGINLTDNTNAVPPKQVVRTYPYSSETAARMKPPQNGEIYITGALCKAMEEYGDSVVYEIEIYLIQNAESYLNNEAEWMQEYERISDIMKEEPIGLSTYNDGDGQKHYMLLGVVSRDFISNFPASGQYGYFIQLSGDTVGDCTAEDPNVSVYNGAVSQK